jgi:hypothetical protein
MAGILTVQTIQGPTTGANANKVIIPAGQTLEINEGIALPSGTTLPAGVGGKLLQLQSTTKTDTFSYSGSSFTDVTGLSVSITPSSTSSKIYVQASVSMGGPGGITNDGAFRFMRDTTAIGIGDASGNRARATFAGFAREGYEMASGSGMFLDTPSTTNTITYKIQMKANGQTLYVNRSENNDDSGGAERGISTITVMEIAG